MCVYIINDDNDNDEDGDIFVQREREKKWRKERLLHICEQSKTKISLQQLCESNISQRKPQQILREKKIERKFVSRAVKRNRG